MTCNPEEDIKAAVKDIHDNHDKMWEATIRFIALHQHVLVVAKTRIEGAWSAFCGPVPGMNHQFEWQEVTQTGEVLPEKVARVLFPEYDELPYAY